ncbi:DUF4374 domain-containing protein [Aquimarina aquimarini]|uniref:DUF4374 domain-containing protein n=1 Tax=Aquimarina aquimarini TaxID=1191734 RepID=UPI000D553A3B|nr:DUF4374 domain-containing protein [Aquimarina aquimarini]
MKKQITNLAVIFGILLLVSACSKDDDNPVPNGGNDGNGGEKKEFSYLLALSLPTIDSYPFHILKDVEEGTADIDKSQEIPDLPYNVPVVGKDGFIYLNSAEKLTKYEVDENGILVDIGSVTNLGISGGPVFEFLDDTRLLISSGPRSTSDGVFSYQIINTKNMTEESNGTITLPVDPNSQAVPSAYIHKDGKIFVPYIHSDENFASYNRAPVAIFDATTFNYEKTIYTENAAGLGFSVVSSHGFAENGDLYIAACNTNYWASNETIPSGIVKIKAGESEFDNSYFFNLTEKFSGNHTGGFLYLGSNKALVQVFRGDLIQEYKDYQGGFVIEYHLIDLITKTTEKLNLPLLKYPRRAMELIGDGKVAIVGNTENDGNNIYIYDSATNSVSIGLKYEGTQQISTFMTFR